MRHRLVKLIVQPVIVLDDGENLTDVPTEPFTVPASALDAFPDEMRAAVARLDDDPALREKGQR